ncbi:MAG: NrdJb [Pseudomonadales bacterium]
MVRKLENRITDVAVRKAHAEVVEMHEKLARPPVLQGSTYKIKTPLSEHSLYVTVNDIILNPGTEHELQRPFEIFINSKNMDHFQWIVALTRIMSAVFRKGGDVTFLVEELHSVFDPKGGYLKRGGRFVPSLVAEIGDVLEQHLKRIGILAEVELDAAAKVHLEEKRAQAASAGESDTHGESGFPDTAGICRKCSTKALVYLDGCETCLACGYSRCG